MINLIKDFGKHFVINQLKLHIFIYFCYTILFVMVVLYLEIALKTLVFIML